MIGLTALRLARVSNLPTVWTNAMAGVALAGGDPFGVRTLVLAAALSLFYSGGMFLNDAFDHAIDRRERPQRPIPSGAVSLEGVFAAGFAMLLAGLALVVWAAAGFAPPTTWHGPLAGIGLAAAILFYDWNHKGDPLSPVSMALCRALAYLTAGFAAVTPAEPGVWTVALVGGCHIVGLTYVARQENLTRLENLWPLAFLAVPLFYGLWLALGSGVGLALSAGLAICVGLALHWLRRREPGDVKRAVVTLIAAVALLDGIFLAASGWPAAALVAALAFGLALVLQRFVPGT
jgi:4-hydroxybenzoate polyprenyltransferase